LATHHVDALSLHDALPILAGLLLVIVLPLNFFFQRKQPSDIGLHPDGDAAPGEAQTAAQQAAADPIVDHDWVNTDWTLAKAVRTDRKSTRLNSSHVKISYA